MLRLFVIAFIMYLIYSLASKYLKKPKTGDIKTDRSNGPKVSDELVEDPVCGTYVPKGSAIGVTVEGKTYFFCSNQCMERFLRERTG